MDAEDFKLSLKRLGLTQKRFAKLTGYHENTIGRFAQGKAAVPKHLVWLLQEIESKERIAGLIRMQNKVIDADLKEGREAGRHEHHFGWQSARYHVLVRFMQELQTLLNIVDWMGRV
jgi:transcriptional regulator with XRE-family HTH domain